MATLKSIIAEVHKFLKEKTVADADVKVKINEGLLWVAKSLTLPVLESSGTFTTDPLTNRVAIPLTWNFHKGLYNAGSALYPRLQVYPSLAHLTRKEQVNLENFVNGPLTAVTIVDEELVYVGSPEVAVEVTCRFYKKPTPLVSGTDIPSCIDENYQMDLLSNYALWRLFALKEDGLEGLKVNTAYHKGLFNEALQEFRETTKTGVSEPEPDRSTTWI